MQLFSLLLFDSPYMPQGYCYLWNWPLVWLHLVSDSLVGLAYLSISFTIFYFVHKRRDAPFQPIFLWFGAFIIASGVIHLMEVWNLWHADYWLAGLVKAVTAVVSVATAGYLVTLVPEALALPSPQQFVEANARLAREVAERESGASQLRQLNEELEARVQNRTAELEATMGEMQKGIDERRRTEEELRRWEWVFAHAGWGVAIANPQTYVLEAVNPAFASMHGCTVEELLGKPLADMFAPEWREKLPELARLTDEKGHHVYESMHIRKDGACFPVLTDVTAFKDRDGKVLYRSANFQDITDRKRAQTELQKTNERLTELLHDTEQRSREATLIKQMSTLLQTCATTEEACLIVRDFAGRLFPNDSGALCLLNPSVTLMDAVATWGQAPLREPVFAPEGCWALRTGQIHVSGPDGLTLHCSHVATPIVGSYVCVPMSAQSEALGLFHVRGNTEEAGLPENVCIRAQQNRQRLAVDFAADIALASANLRLRETLRTQSIRDPLTGLFNRRYMTESLDREVKSAERSKRPLGIIMLDLDEFKPFNDAHGHEAGDTLLRTFARFIQKHTRGADVACRYGGDEFMILLVDADLENTRRRADALREEFRKIVVRYMNRKLEAVSFSIGVAACPEHGATSEDLLAAADEALYDAKAKGRNRVSVYNGRA
jgi:diguanylate cyclase (GGDEF)-like protein/PAS domain S-box-containing protein